MIRKPKLPLVLSLPLLGMLSNFRDIFSSNYVSILTKCFYLQFLLKHHLQHYHCQNTKVLVPCSMKGWQEPSRGATYSRNNLQNIMSLMLVLRGSGEGHKYLIIPPLFTEFLGTRKIIFKDSFKCHLMNKLCHPFQLYLLKISLIKGLHLWIICCASCTFFCNIILISFIFTVTL